MPARFRRIHGGRHDRSLGLGLKRGEKLFGTHCASGMHGGKIFVRGAFPKENLSANIKVSSLTKEDEKSLTAMLKILQIFRG